MGRIGVLLKMHWQCVLMCSLILLHSFVYTHNLSRKKRSGDFFETGFPFNLRTYQTRRYNAFPYPYPPFPVFPKFAQPLFNPPAVIPYPSILHSYHHKKQDDEEVAPIIIPAGAAAALSVASLLHALISKKYDPPYIPIPITNTLPVPVPLKVPVPLPINKYIPIGVSTSKRNQYDNNFDVQIHEAHPSKYLLHESQRNSHWTPMEKPHESEDISLVTTSAPSIFTNNILSEKDNFEENNWERKFRIKQKRKQKVY